MMKTRKTLIALGLSIVLFCCTGIGVASAGKNKEMVKGYPIEGGVNNP
jgi:hypothetical protein